MLENVTLAPGKVSKLGRQEAEAIALKQLGHVGLSDKNDAYPSRLSDGQQQRMAIARALPPPGETIWEQSRWIARDEGFRRFMLNEPRGGMLRHVGLLVPADTPSILPVATTVS